MGRNQISSSPRGKDFLAGKITLEHLFLESPEEGEGADPLQAEWLLGSAARSLEAGTRTVTLDDGTEIKADGVNDPTFRNGCKTGVPARFPRPAYR